MIVAYVEVAIGLVADWANAKVVVHCVARVSSAHLASCRRPYDGALRQTVRFRLQIGRHVILPYLEYSETGVFFAEKKVGRSIFVSDILLTRPRHQPANVDQLMYPFLEPVGLPNTLAFCPVLPRANRIPVADSCHFSSSNSTFRGRVHTRQDEQRWSQASVPLRSQRSGA